jgi:hypothetical protein
MISVSAIRGGNPSAKADPEGFAAEWTQCGSCRSFTCDRCLASQSGRCRCGAPATLFSEDQRIEVALRMMGVGGPPQAAAPGAIAVARVGAPPPPNPLSRNNGLAIGALVAVVGGLVGLWAMGAAGAVVGVAVGAALGFAIGTGRL